MLKDNISCLNEEIDECKMVFYVKYRVIEEFRCEIVECKKI